MTVGNEFTRNNVSMNLTSKVTKNIEVGTNMAYTNSFDDSVAASLSYKNSPYMEPYLPDGKTLRYYVEGVNASSVNPLWTVQDERLLHQGAVQELQLHPREQHRRPPLQ